MLLVCAGEQQRRRQRQRWRQGRGGAEREQGPECGRGTSLVQHQCAAVRCVPLSRRAQRPPWPGPAASREWRRRVQLVQEERRAEESERTGQRGAWWAGTGAHCCRLAAACAAWPLLAAAARATSSTDDREGEGDEEGSWSGRGGRGRGGTGEARGTSSVNAGAPCCVLLVINDLTLCLLCFNKIVF